ncbi:MAG TPA: SBBP repeat-containing protein, partial [Bryobacteraceae bacterium]|nr:SBBP repeat-containing protein [Bryobacteraceae bacterium]
GQDDFGLAIAIDPTGAAYITGGTTSVAFPVTQAAFQHSYFGSGGQKNTFTFGQPLINAGDAFVTKLDPTGSSIIFSTYLGSNLDDVGSAIALDSSNNVFVAGFTLSSAFPTTTGALQTRFGGADSQNQFFQTGDGFITKLKADGSGQIYSTFFGGTGDDYVQAIAPDKAGNLYFAGSSGSIRLPTTQGVFQPAFSGPATLPNGIESVVGDAFVGKLNPTGSGLVYLTYLGGTGNDSATALAVDDDGNAYVGGFADSTNFPLTKDALQGGRDGGSGDIQFFSFGDTFLSVLDPAGDALLYSTYLGGGRDDILFGLTLDPAGKIYIAGNTLSTNFRTTTDGAQRTFGGAKNVFTFPQGDGFYSVFSPISKGPVITGVSNAESGVALLAPNTWTAIYGRALAGPTARTWRDSDFSNNQMPTSLDGVTVTMNGKNAFVFYISPTQVSVLTPADLAPGPVQVQVTFAGATSTPFTVQAQATSPSFFVINGGPYVLATHADGNLLGPATLFPGATTPGTSGETVVVYANGFGAVSDPVVSGSGTQSGNLTPLPVIRVGSIPANVRFAGLISPGLYQFNFDIPPGLPAGDNAIVAIMNGVSTPSGTLITLK